VNNQITNWLNHSGTAWTVQRVKALYQAALQLKSCNYSSAVEIYQTHSIAYHKHSKVPKGPFGVVVRSFVTTTKEQAARRFLGVLRLYTSWTMASVKKDDIEKHISSITSPCSTERSGFFEYWETRLEEWARKLRPYLPGYVTPSLLDFKPHKGSHIRYVDGIRKVDLVGKPYANQIASLVTTRPPDFAEDYFQSVGQGNLSKLAKFCLASNLHDEVGHISILRDRGYKTRAVAVPSFWYQLIFQPLHVRLDALAKRLSSSTVHDQNKGAFALLDALEQGRKLHSFDLSSATDRFPLGLQLAVLRGLGLKEWVPRVVDSCQRWNVQGWPDRVAYAIGQPMGLYSSFPLFHLTHIGLLTCLCSSRSVGTDVFKVQGDDVQVTDPAVAEAYETELRILGVEISKSKSFISYQLGEFAGFVGMWLGLERPIAFRPYKWGPTGVTRESWVNLIHFLGRKSPHTGPLSYREAKLWYEEEREYLYPDLSSMIPSDDPGGIPGQSTDFTRLRLLIAQLFAMRRLTETGDFYRAVALELLGQHNVDADIIATEMQATRRPIAVTPEVSEEDLLDSLFLSLKNEQLGVSRESSHIRTVGFMDMF